MLTKERIHAQMHTLEEKTGLQFNDITWLTQAMDSTPLPKEPTDGKHKKTDCNNTALATVGDAVLKAILADRLFKGNLKKGQITILKQELERNSTLHRIQMKEELLQYAYNDHGFFDDPHQDHQKVATSAKHPSYIEATVAAIYYDKGFDEAKKWVNDYLFPRLWKEAFNTELP